MKNKHNAFCHPPHNLHIYRDQKGSIILIVMMILVMMSVIGIASTNTSTTESLITRNTNIREQNVAVVDTGVTEALQRVLDAGYSDDHFLSQAEIDPSSAYTLDWVHSDSGWGWKDWNDPDFPGRLLKPDNSEVPNLDDDSIGIARILHERGEWNSGSSDPDSSPIRYAVVGWKKGTTGGGKGGNKDETVDKEKRKASILAEYVSDKYGVMRLTIGVIKIFEN